MPPDVDFFSFNFKGSEPIKLDDEYRTGRRLVFDTAIGGQRRGVIKVDLVIGCMPVGDLERITPAHRLDIKGLSAIDYYLYPIADTVADKVCATLAAYSQGRRSSRVKDLVDLVVIATTTSLDASTVREAVCSEARQRGLGITSFTIPDAWRTAAIGATYQKEAKEAGIPGPYFDIEAAEELVKRLVEPPINDETLSLQWSPSRLDWGVF